MTTTKITKREKYNMLAEILGLAADNGIEGYDFDMLTEFVNKEVAMLDKKAAKARENAAAKHAETDELCDVIESLLTDEPQTREDIMAQIEGDDISANKISYRLTKLFSLGKAKRIEVLVEGGADGKSKKRMAYTKA